MATRNVVSSGVVYSQGKAWLDGQVVSRLLAYFATDDFTHPKDAQTWEIDIDGTFTMTLVVPETGTVLYEFVLPSGETFQSYIGSGGSDLAFEALVAGSGGEPEDIESFQTMIDASLALLELGDLADVDTGTPSDGDVLTWDDGAGEWVAAAPAGGTVAWGDITGKPTTLSGYGITDAAALAGATFTGQLLLADSGFRFGSETNTGAYWAGAGDFRFLVQGAARLILFGNRAIMGLIEASDGDLTQLGYSFNSDPNTGMYRVASDTLGFGVGGILGAQVKATGGAGTTALWLYDDDDNTLRQVEMGADDSGGTGYKLLRIAN